MGEAEHLAGPPVNPRICEGLPARRLVPFSQPLCTMSRIISPITDGETEVQKASEACSEPPCHTGHWGGLWTLLCVPGQNNAQQPMAVVWEVDA